MHRIDSKVTFLKVKPGCLTTNLSLKNIITLVHTSSVSLRGISMEVAIVLN